MGLTPAAVSYQIKEIEDRLGLVLFTRTSRSIQLTPSGAVLFEAAVQALETLQRAVGRARRMARGARQLRVSLSPRFATNWLLPRLSQFRAANPGIELTFDITDEVRDFDADDVDVAVRFGSGRYRQTQSERLFEAAIAPVASPKLIAASGRPKIPRDLFGQTLCHVECTTSASVLPTTTPITLSIQTARRRIRELFPFVNGCLARWRRRNDRLTRSCSPRPETGLCPAIGSRRHGDAVGRP